MSLCTQHSEKSKMIIRFPAFLLRLSQHLHFLKLTYSQNILVTVLQQMEMTNRNDHLLFPHKRELIGCCRKQCSDAVESSAKSWVSMPDEYGWVANSESQTSKRTHAICIHWYTPLLAWNCAGSKWVIFWHYSKTQSQCSAGYSPSALGVFENQPRQF